MSATHEHAGHAHAQASGQLHDTLGVNQRDPTQTSTLRSQYAAQYRKRFRRLKGLVWQTIVRDDVLRRGVVANQDGPIDPDDEVDWPDPDDVPDIPGSGSPAPTAVPGDGDSWTVEEYLAWYDRAQRRLVYGPVSEGGIEWSDKYVEYAYQKGVTDADTRSERLGLIEVGEGGTVSPSFNMPIHQDTIADVIARNRGGLDGVTSATSRTVRDELVDSVIAGENPRVAARRINDRIDAIGMTRAETHARTTIVGSYNEGALRRYEQTMGSDTEVTILVEFSTAGDDRVCERCLELAGNVYSVREARGILPVHPRCRCTWLPKQRGVDASDGGVLGA